MKNFENVQEVENQRKFLSFCMKLDTVSTNHRLNWNVMEEMVMVDAV